MRERHNDLAILSIDEVEHWQDTALMLEHLDDLLVGVLDELAQVHGCSRSDVSSAAAMISIIVGIGICLTRYQSSLRWISSHTRMPIRRGSISLPMMQISL